MNRLADLFEGVTHTLILAGGDEDASTAAVTRIRELAQRDPELSASVAGVLARYGYDILGK